jgi:hypothetical protein
MVLAAFSVIIPAVVDVTVLSLETSIAADVLGRVGSGKIFAKNRSGGGTSGKNREKSGVTEKGAAVESKVNLQIDAGRRMRTYQ